MKHEFSLQIFEKYSSVFMKFRPVGAELFNVDGGTDRHDEAIRNFSNACKKWALLCTSFPSLPDNLLS